MSEEPREPRLDAIHVPDRPRAVVLVLHGGQQRSTQPVRNRNASWWRMLLVAKSRTAPSRAARCTCSTDRRTGGPPPP